MSNNTLNRIAALLAAAGPIIRKEMVYTGEKGKDDYKELGEYEFKRLSFFETDKLRLHSVNDKGRFDPELHAGNNARMVAATLVDEHGNNCMPIESVNMWPAWMVDAFGAAANRVNSISPDSIERVSGNSEPTPDDAQ